MVKSSFFIIYQLEIGMQESGELLVTQIELRNFAWALLKQLNMPRLSAFHN